MHPAAEAQGARPVCLEHLRMSISSLPRQADRHRRDDVEQEPDAPAHHPAAPGMPMPVQIRCRALVMDLHTASEIGAYPAFLSCISPRRPFGCVRGPQVWKHAARRSTRAQLLFSFHVRFDAYLLCPLLHLVMTASRARIEHSAAASGARGAPTVPCNRDHAAEPMAPLPSRGRNSDERRRDPVYRKRGQQ